MPPEIIDNYFMVAHIDVIPGCSQTVAQAFQPVQAQAKACGYRKQLFDRNLLSR
jgi:hypothetical protein